MIEDVLKSIRAALYERTTSPLFGAFSLSWIVWNHRLFFVLFSGKPVDNKFQYIDTVLYGDSFWRWIFLVVGPLVTAGFFLFAYPYPAKWVYKFWRNRQKEMKAIRQKIEDETPLTIEESRELRRQMVRLQREYEQDIRSTVEERDELKEAQEALQDRERDLSEQVGSLQAQSVSYEKRVADLKREIPRKIEESEGRDTPLALKADIKSALLGRRWRLVFNPEAAKSKTMTFRDNGIIDEGRNKNEASWRIVGGHLELIQVDDQVHSRFNYIPQSQIFTHTGDPDTKSIRGQYILPEA